MTFQVIGAVVPIALFVAVVCALGWKMLRLARTTGEPPERFLGSGFAIMGLVVAPLAGIGRIPVLTSTPFGKLCLGAGMLGVGVAVGCLYAFTYTTFRRGTGWARGLALSATLGGFVASAGFGWVNHAGASLDEVLASARPWIHGIIGFYMLCFVWNRGRRCSPD